MPWVGIKVVFGSVARGLHCAFIMRSRSWAVLAAAVLAACSSALDGAGPPSGAPQPGVQSGASGAAAIGGSFSSAGNAPIVAPEQEDTLSFRAPVVSGRWVWTANPDTGKIAVVDAKSFSVRLADAGVSPTFLTALPSDPESSQALVINVGSHDATLLTAEASGPVTALGSIPLAPDVNAWAVSKNGKFALAWTDSHAIPADPADNFQDISVLDLRGAEPVATRLVVGLLPSRVFIDDAERLAFVVAKTGISVIDLAGAGGPRVLREQAVSTDPLHENAATRDVSVMPDGTFALVRHEGSPLVTLVDLVSGALSTVTLPGPITDLDLTADASSALAVVRAFSVPLPGGDGGAGGEAGLGNGGAGESALAGAGAAGSGGVQNPSILDPRSSLIILPVPGIFTAPTAFDTATVEEVFGLVNIAPEGSSALLYTNAVANSHLTVLETARGASYLSHRTVDLRGNVNEVFPSPDGAYAIVSLKPTVAGGKSGFAAVPISHELPARVQTTEAPVFAVAQSAGPTARAVVTVSDGVATFAAYVVRMPELVTDPVKLPSRPLPGATGLVPDAGMAYIAQQHPQGRITFIDLETGVPRTITGFEISAKVSNGR